MYLSSEFKEEYGALLRIYYALEDSIERKVDFLSDEHFEDPLGNTIKAQLEDQVHGDMVEEGEVQLRNISIDFDAKFSEQLLPRREKDMVRIIHNALRSALVQRDDDDFDPEESSIKERSRQMTNRILGSQIRISGNWDYKELDLNGANLLDLTNLQLLSLLRFISNILFVRKIQRKFSGRNKLSQLQQFGYDETLYNLLSEYSNTEFINSRLSKPFVQEIQDFLEKGD